MWQMYLSSVPKNNGYLQWETIDHLGLLVRMCDTQVQYIDDLIKFLDLELVYSMGLSLYVILNQAC